MGTGRAMAIGVLLALVLAAPAQAVFKRAPIELGAGDGSSPSVVMDPAGTAHVVWGVADELIGYCAVPRGTRRCATTATLALDARSGPPFIVRRPQDGALIVVAGRSDRAADPPASAWAFTSADGVTWSAPAPIGLGIGDDLAGAVLTADGLAVDLVQERLGDGVLFQRAPLAGPPAAALVGLSNAPDGRMTAFAGAGDLVRLRNGRTLALLDGERAGIGQRVLTGADPFAEASWTPWPAARVTTEDTQPRAASGRRGTFLLYALGPVAQVNDRPAAVVRRLRVRRWGRPRGLFYEVRATNLEHTAALAQDGRGRLHAAIVGRTFGGRYCITYARSAKRGRFTRAASLHMPLRAADEPGRLRLAVDERSRGVVAWSTTGTPAAVRVQRVAPGKGRTRPRPFSARGCPAFPR